MKILMQCGINELRWWIHGRCNKKHLLFLPSWFSEDDAWKDSLEDNNNQTHRYVCGS